MSLGAVPKWRLLHGGGEWEWWMGEGQDHICQDLASQVVNLLSLPELCSHTAQPELGS